MSRQEEAVFTIVYGGELRPNLQRLEEMEDAEIGAILREAIPMIRRERARDAASRLWGMDAKEHSHGPVKQLLETRDTLRHGSDDPMVAEVLAEIEEGITRAQSRLAIPEKRQLIQSNYDALFVQIGRRDGFRCAACETVDDIEIDHIKPLIMGGTNELENLQFLCGRCNRMKGDEHIDCRSR